MAESLDDYAQRAGDIDDDRQRRSTPWYPNPAPDGVPDAYRLHPSGTVVYQGFGGVWYGWDTKLPLASSARAVEIALDGATPLYLSGQAVAP